MLQVIRIDGNVGWNVHRGPSGAYVAVCDALGLTLGGDTFDEMIDTIQEGIRLLMSDLLETGELAEFLRARRWTVHGGIPKHDGNVVFDLPYELRQVTDAQACVS